jgi:hypothetical protein
MIMNSFSFRWFQTRLNRILFCTSIITGFEQKDNNILISENYQIIIIYWKILIY